MTDIKGGLPQKPKFTAKFNRMKSILVLTDFSENAMHAAIQAVLIARKINAKIVLFYNHVPSPATPNYAGGIWLKQEISKKLAEEEQVLAAKATRLLPAAQMPHISSMSSEGELSGNLSDIVRRKEVGLICMGAGANNTVDHLLFGSETNIVISYAACPVLIVPPKNSDRLQGKILFATDFDDADMSAGRYLVKLGKRLDFPLEIVHVHEAGDLVIDKNIKKKAFLHRVSGLAQPGVTYYELFGDDVARQLQRYRKKSGAAMLAMVNRRHSFFDKLFQKGVTKQILAGQHTPLMIFPAK